GDDLQSISLLFENHFYLGIAYHLTLSSDLKNCIGESLSGILEFELERSKKAEFGDLLINEIMADPTPTQGLPEAEYIELFNQTNYPIDLTNWSLTIGNSDFRFTEYTLKAKSYIILTQPNKAGLFMGYCDAMEMPAFNLSNNEDQIVLRNQRGQVIHFIHYQKNWYNDNFKAEGGWSLEMIEQEYFCEQEANWSASENSIGGTPGMENSVKNKFVDFLRPEIKWIDIKDQNTLSLHFSKSMDTIQLNKPANYMVDNALGIPDEVKIFSPDYTVSQLRFSKSFNENTHYEINLNRSISGCNGFELETYTAYFALPQEVEAGDIVINEILFDAWQDDGDYVEFFNRSEKVIDSRKLIFSRIGLNLYDTSFYSLQANTGQIFPKEYIVFCKNKSAVLDVYFSENPSLIYEFNDFPSLPNSAGSVLLSKASNRNEAIDALNYSASMHHSLMNNTKGKALERISSEKETNDANNWITAASNVNFGTPAYKNSQFQDPSENEEIIQISPEIFTPDADGIDDLLNINYSFSESGYTLNLIIFNAQKQQINHLIKNEIMSPSGQIFWNGCTEEGDKAPIGIYILYFEYFDLAGHVEKIKKTCVLGGKL
ncbi:MAG: lamin tail domain-containing protein, partial [Bacteroidales bacterium]|nr:lamin tail domain-containing protein [Bacteroidales bacterium]